MKIAVLGAGNGGQALAAHLTLLGEKVFLYEHPKFSGKLDAIHEQKNCIQLQGELEGNANLFSVTSDIQEVMSHCEILFFVTPSFAQEEFLDLSIPFFRAGQIVIFVPGNFGSLVARKKLKEKGLNEGIGIVETDTLPYACRQSVPGRVDVWGVKKFLSISCLPSSNNKHLLPLLESILPIRINPLKNVINVAFANTNMIIHCPTMIMNTGRIESEKIGFKFYAQGMTKSVCKIMEAMDLERLRIGKRFSLSLISEYEDAISSYGCNEKYSSLFEVLTNNPVYSNHGNDSPKSMDFRYLSEDVPFLLVPVSEMGKLAGIYSPVINSTIVYAETINGIQYRKIGRTLEKMGLEGLAVNEIVKSVA
ncbi:MAG TPA: hypothetical protein DF698_04910 [Candidatus Atribacteria bacterium]|nr:hypothetical protein [Candidatus Atribacteria bacterium]